MPRSLFRLVLALLLSALLAAACGDDADSSAEDAADADQTTVPPDDEDDTATSDVDTEADDEPVTTTTTADETTPTTDSAGGSTGVLAEGTVTTEDGLRADWELSATSTSLCFDAELTHPDPELAASAGEGVSACLEPEDGLDAMESGLSVDIGTVDGGKTIGFLWGRVAPDVIALTIEHTDASQTPIDILEGPTEVQVFAYVVEIATIPPVQDLDAVSGTQIEGSEPIREFLRSGPTYPVVSSTTSTAPTYPVS